MAVAEGLDLAAQMAQQAAAVHRIEAARMRDAFRLLEADIHEARAEEAIGLAAAFMARSEAEDTDPGLVPLASVIDPWWRRLWRWFFG